MRHSQLPLRPSSHNDWCCYFWALNPCRSWDVCWRGSSRKHWVVLQGWSTSIDLVALTSTQGLLGEGQTASDNSNAFMLAFWAIWSSRCSFLFLCNSSRLPWRWLRLCKCYGGWRQILQYSGSWCWCSQATQLRPSCGARRYQPTRVWIFFWKFWLWGFKALGKWWSCSADSGIFITQRSG